MLGSAYGSGGCCWLTLPAGQCSACVRLGFCGVGQLPLGLCSNGGCTGGLAGTTTDDLVPSARVSLAPTVFHPLLCGVSSWGCGHVVLFVTWLVASCHQGPAQGPRQGLWILAGVWFCRCITWAGRPPWGSHVLLCHCWLLLGSVGTAPRDTIRPAWCWGGVETWASGLRPFCSLPGCVSHVSAVQISQSESGSFPSQSLGAAFVLCQGPASGRRLMEGSVPPGRLF